ncbi:MAG: hypothetical protein ACRCX8_11415 [Sarcina sp.]
MRNLINYIDVIETNLQKFNYVIVDVKDYTGKLYKISFGKSQDVVKKCEHMENVLGDNNKVLYMKCG